MAKREPKIDLNPSSADRWMTCTASPQFILGNWDKVPEDSSSSFSQEGTTAHEVAAALLQGREPDPKNCPTPINSEMRRHAWNYAEYVGDLRGPGGKIIIEQKLPLWYMPGRNAIVDAAIINSDSLHVIDLKYGAGIMVNVERNLQAVIYAYSIGYGLVLPLDFPVSLHIYQPRSRDAAEPYTVWETTWREVSAIAKDIRNTATYILKGDSLMQPVFAPSDKACQWCPAKGFCSARQETLLGDIEALAVIDEEPKNFPPVKAISVKQLSAILKHKADIIKWLNDAEAYALEHMQGGGSIPGYKLVLSRGGNRYWSNPSQAEKLLLNSTVLRREEIITEKLISPAQAEKLVGKQKFNAELTNLIAKEPGSPVVAPEDDKRESYISAQVFDALDGVTVDDF